MLPIAKYGFALYKSAFCDAFYLRYGWHPSNLPLQCTCGKQFLEHALSWSHGCFPSICHNKLCNITVELMSRVCHNIGTEPSLQPITIEHLIHRTANREDGASSNVAADSFWVNDRQCTFFDIGEFNSLAPSYQNTPLAQCSRRNEQERK